MRKATVLLARNGCCTLSNKIASGEEGWGGGFLGGGGVSHGMTSHISEVIIWGHSPSRCLCVVPGCARRQVPHTACRAGARGARPWKVEVPCAFASQAMNSWLGGQGQISPGYERQQATGMPALQAANSQFTGQGVQCLPSGCLSPPLHEI